MATGPSSSYDEMPYGDNFFPHTHPDYLATVGRLFGIDVPPAATSRVLELGCAGGGNLIPMALELPEARFVGVDLSPRQVESGRQVIQRLALTNVDLQAMSILEVDDRLGSFDFIVCHGVYSWVPEVVRDKILEICSERLNPNGIAYLSYNTYPGWHARGMVREMMTFHVRGTTSAIERVEKARDFLENLVQVIRDPSSAYARIVRTESEFLQGVANSYLYHEHLEETNHPVYFHELIDLARARGLRFLAEARTPGLVEHLPAEARELLGSWAIDEVSSEQYLDFLCNRTFRRTLLCRVDVVRLDRPSPEVVSTLWVGSNVTPAQLDADARSDDPLEFRNPDGSTGLTTNNPLVKAALLTLHQARHLPMPFATLLDQVRARLGPEAVEDDQAVLERSLLRCFLSNLVDLYLQPPRFAVEVPARPLASPLARLQAETGNRVVNLRRRTVELADFVRVVLRQLDGQRDQAGIIKALMGLVESGDFTLYQAENPIENLAEVEAIFQAEVAPCLERLAELALLAG